MNQPWTFSEFSHAVSEGQEELPLSSQSNPIHERNPSIWYPQTSWDMVNPTSAAFNNTSLGDHVEPTIPEELDLQVPQHLSSNSSEYGSIYTPPLPGTAFDERQQASRQPFQFASGMDMDAGNTGDETASGGSGSGSGPNTGPLLDPRRHHHYMRGRSADDIHRETLSRDELRRAQNRNSQRSFRRRREERLRELEAKVEDLETQVRGLEETNRVLEARNELLEARNQELEAWNRELNARDERLRQELEVLRARMRASGDLWELALLDLKTRNKLSFDLGRTDRRVVLEEVLSEVLRREQICKDKRWKWKNRKGETIIVRDVFAKMVKWINKFKEIGDMVTQYDPGHAALPWAAVRLVLQVVVNDEAMQAAMAEGLETIFNLIARYEIVERMFLQTQLGVHKELEEGIIKLYTAILFYLSEIYRFYSNNAVGRLASGVKASQEGIEKIEIAESQVHDYMQLASHEVAQTTGRSVDTIQTSVQQVVPIFEGVKEISTGMQELNIQVSGLSLGFEELRSILKDLNRPISRIASALLAIKDGLDETERLKVFEWLTDVRYLRHHREKTKSLLKGSGQWLLQKAEFLDWVKSSTSSILWLHGIPGSGKSMLVATVIEYLRTASKESENSAPLGYFYCVRNTNEPERADPEVILRSVLEQLCSSNQHSPIREPVSQAYISARDDARGRSPDKLTLEETVDIILKLLMENPAFIILDGLDETHPRKRQELLNSLRNIIKKSDNIVKIFVSSRDDHDLVHHLEDTPNLYIHATDNKGDIESFVHSRVSQAIEEERLLCGKVSPRLRRHITSVLIEKAQGMFRLVSLHIETLCDPQLIKTEDNVYNALQRLPKDLQNSYSIILDQIRHSEEPNPKIAETTLKWLLCARTTLSSTTLPLAISMNFTGTSLLNRSEILSVCANLVIYDAESDVFRLAHLSVREYLENHKDYESQENHRLAAESCIKYLLNDPYILINPHPRTDPWNSNHVFIIYCFKYWMNHVQLAPDKRKIGTLRESLLKIMLFHGIQLYGKNEKCVTGKQSLTSSIPKLWYRQNSEINALFVACVYGLSEIVEEIVSNAKNAKPTATAYNLSIQNSKGMNCVEIAAHFGKTSLVPILYEASQYGKLPDTYWYSIINTTVDRKVGRAFKLIEEVLNCTRHNFLTNEVLIKVIQRSTLKGFSSRPEFKRMLLNLTDRCEGTTLPNAIIRAGDKTMLLHWLTLDKTLQIDNEILLSIISQDDGLLTRILLSREESLSISDEAIQLIILTRDTLRMPPNFEMPESWTKDLGSTCIQLLLRRSENFTIPSHLLRGIITKWDAPTTQLLLQRKDNYSATIDIIDEFRTTRNERIRDLLWKTVLVDLDPEIEHTSLVLSLGDTTKTSQLLEKTRIEITEKVIEAVSKNFRHGKDVMKLLLSQNPGIRISTDLLQTAVSTGNLQIVNLLVPHASAVWADDGAMNKPRKAEVLEFMTNLEEFCGR